MPLPRRDHKHCASSERATPLAICGSGPTRPHPALPNMDDRTKSHACGWCCPRGPAGEGQPGRRPGRRPSPRHAWRETASLGALAQKPGAAELGLQRGCLCPTQPPPRIPPWVALRAGSPGSARGGHAAGIKGGSPGCCGALGSDHPCPPSPTPHPHAPITSAATHHPSVLLTSAELSLSASQRPPQTPAFRSCRPGPQRLHFGARDDGSHLGQRPAVPFRVGHHGGGAGQPGRRRPRGDHQG